MRTELVNNGKYDRAAIMKRAWGYVKAGMYHKDFAKALKGAWRSARYEMQQYEEMASYKPSFPKKDLRMTDLYWSSNMINGFATR